MLILLERNVSQVNDYINGYINCQYNKLPSFHLLSDARVNNHPIDLPSNCLFSTPIFNYPNSSSSFSLPSINTSNSSSSASLLSYASYLASLQSSYLTTSNCCITSDHNSPSSGPSLPLYYPAAHLISKNAMIYENQIQMQIDAGLLTNSKCIWFDYFKI